MATSGQTDKTARGSVYQKLKDKDRQLRRLQAKYERTQRALESIQDLLPGLPIAIAAVAQDGTVAFANDDLKSLLSRDDIEDLAYTEVFFSEEYDTSSCPIRRSIDHESQQAGDVKLAGKHSRHCIARSVRFSDGRRGVVCVFLEAGRDTRPLESDTQTEKLSALGELISGIAHELNNPLTGVIGFSELLCQREHDARTGEMIRKVLNEAHRCKKIVANLLSFSRKHPYQRTHLDVNQLIQQSLDLLRYELRVNNIDVKCNMDPRLPATMGEPYLLQQVFFNVFHNALQAMSAEAKGGRLTVNTTKKKDMIRVLVTDTGPGIPPEIRAKIFDPFFTTKSPEEGTGLGLSVSNKIVLKHGGAMSVAGSYGSGADFTILLPVTREPQRTGESSRRGEVAREARRGSILIIDDEEAILDLLSEVLENDGHGVTTTTKASEGLRLMSHSTYDCVICDVKMPEVDGREFFELVQTLRPGMTERLIFITGDYFTDATARFVRESGLQYLKKPFSPEELLAATNKILTRYGHAPSDPQ
jgi:signal transduction histidine kinase/ActR/RegA family two-component response regulator